MDLNPPALDELEVSIFGRGFGEAICVHLGDEKWMVVDSCLNPATKAPAALSYLRSLGIDPAKRVEIIVATHWHDDHIQGISEVVRECPQAVVVCSLALRGKEFFAFVVTQEDDPGALGSGVDEFRSVLRQCAKRVHGIVWAKANLPLYPVPPGDRPLVVALSPSDDACTRSLGGLIVEGTSRRVTVPRKYRAVESANGASVAVAVRCGPVALLLGADLETSANRSTGWDAVVDFARPSAKASVVKIPHHGSVGAHCDRMWSELLEPDCLALLTPWVLGGNHLPTNEDLSRIRSRSASAYITARPESMFARKKSEKFVDKLHGAAISELRGWGHIRARRRLTEDRWRIELDGTAVAV